MTEFDPAQTRAEALRSARQVFAAQKIAAADNDARFLVLHALDLTQTELILGSSERIGRAGASRLDTAVRRRLAGEPVARIIGTWEFWGLPFALVPSALVPRPDTETVVEAALALFPTGTNPKRALDLGTGSGCILVALLSEWRTTFGVGVDRSFEALLCARANASTNGVGLRAGFVRSDWCATLSGPFEVIVSNPPYIAGPVLATLTREVRLHDPRAALHGGLDGLAAYREIISQVAADTGEGAMLSPGGSLIFEVGYDQAEAVARLGREAGFADATIRCDLGGHARVVTLEGPRRAGGTRKSPDPTPRP